MKSGKKKFELPPTTEETFIQMCRLLVDAEPILSGAGINVNKQDRLGRTILHIAAQYGLTELTKTLLRAKADDGFGADPLLGDQINQRAIHYAIAFKNEDTFAVLLDHIATQAHQMNEERSGDQIYS